jgi:hypothetical protein
MLRALEPEEGRPRSAYRVPWWVDRREPEHPLVTNVGADCADFVRIFLHERGRPPEMELLGMVVPGESFEVCLCDTDPHQVVTTIAWYRPDDGREYVWRFGV